MSEYEFRALSAEEAADIILNVENPLIAMHKNPDGDAVGTAKAMSVVLEQLGKTWGIICEDSISERLEFIFGEVQRETCGANRQIICVDIASPSQIGDIRDTFQNIPLMIDHHSVGEPFADNYIIPTASSASEALLDIIDVLIKRGLVKMTAELAAPLYTAISSDTGCFCYSNVTSKTMRRAAELIDTGIDFADINHRLFHSKTMSQIKAESFVSSKLMSANEGKIAYVTMTKAEREENHIERGDLECAIDIVKTLKGAEVAFIIKENDKGEFKVSLRSTGPDVASIAKHFGGGGHIRAAGCAVPAESMEEAEKLLMDEILKQAYGL